MAKLNPVIDGYTIYPIGQAEKDGWVCTPMLRDVGIKGVMLEQLWVKFPASWPNDLEVKHEWRRVPRIADHLRD